MFASLDRLATSNEPESFHITNAFNPNPSKRDLLLRNGVYPYEYMDSWDHFNETELPAKDSFYSKLNEDGISDDDYLHARKVWTAFGYKTIGDYHGLYKVTDALLVADVLVHSIY